MLGQQGLGRWDVFQRSVAIAEEAMPSFVDTGSTTTRVVHEYDEAFKPLHIHGLETENARFVHETN